MVRLNPKSAPTLPRWQHLTMLWLHVCVLIGATLLIVLISDDIFRNKSFTADPRYLKIQFWICMVFLLDIFVDFMFNPKRWHWMLAHIGFLLISIPWINILHHYNIHMSGEVEYVVRFIPMLRAAYVLLIISGAFSQSKLSNLFRTYVVMMLVVAYFGSMMFFVEEHHVNPDVDTYWSALWWASMCMTTAGSDIDTYTATGKVLNILLSAMGLVLFPVFTVFVTNAVTSYQQSKPKAKSHKQDHKHDDAAQGDDSTSDNKSLATASSSSSQGE